MISAEMEQLETCKKWGTSCVPTGKDQKVGLSSNVKEGVFPVNGLRHYPTLDTSGWYIWAGEDLSQNDDFFVPFHAEHLFEWRPELRKYLGLSPGWRFLIAPGYEDVWFDPSLLVV